MQRRVSGLVRQQEQAIKAAVRDWFSQNDPSYPQLSELLQSVYDVPNLQLSGEDFQRRKRVKNHVPIDERCLAKRATGERCTRRKRHDSEFCGTHMKGTPHGIFTAEPAVPTTKIVELFLREVTGIGYYHDKEMNVYSTEDIVKGHNPPRIVGKLVPDESKNDLTIVLN